MTGLRRLMNESRYSEALLVSTALQSGSIENPEINYLLGLAALKRYQLNKAKEYFTRTTQSKYKSKFQTKAVTWLARIDKLKSLMPCVIGASPDSYRNRIIVRSNCDSKNNEVLLKYAKVLPRLADLIFPNSSSCIEVIIFKDPSVHKDFFHALSDESPFQWQSAAAAYGVVIASSEGVHHLGHEYGHAVCREFYGDGYNETVPNWLDEAIADQFSGEDQHEADYLERVSDGQKKPIFCNFVSDFYAQPELNYLIAALVGNEIFSTNISKVFCIPIILRLIRYGLDANEAVELVSGESPEKIFDRVISRIWKS